MPTQSLHGCIHGGFPSRYPPYPKLDDAALILTPFRPIKLTHLGRQKSALAFVLQSIALSSQHEDV